MNNYNYNNNKRIYICHKNLESIIKYSITWKRLNPDWKIELYDDNRCRDFLLKEYSEEFVRIFDYLKDGPIKSDFWRCCIINRYGGLYVDADILPIEALYNIIDPSDYFVSCLSYQFVEKNANSWNPHFLYTFPGNCILRKTIENYLIMFRLNISYSYWTYSICTIWRKNIKECEYLTKLIIKTGSYHIKIGNRKYKFLTERRNIIRKGYEGNNPLYRIGCTYNNKVVLYNRLLEYDTGKHKFKEENNNKNKTNKKENLKYVIQGPIKLPPRDNKIHMLTPGIKKINLNIVRD